MATLKTITAPVAEPVDVAELRDVLRIDDATEDARLFSLIIAARQWAEDYTDTKLMSQVVELNIDRFPSNSFVLDAYPIQSVDSVKYDSTDSPSVETTLTVDVDYRVDIDSKNGRIISIGGWPSVYQKFNSVRVRMTVGYAAVDDVPEGIKEGIKIYAASLYECNPAMTKAAESILWHFRNIHSLRN